jgi:hypothetical protein
MEGGKAVHERDWVPVWHYVYEFFGSQCVWCRYWTGCSGNSRPANGPLCSRRVVEADSRICDPQHVTGSHDLGSGFGECPFAGLVCDAASIAHASGRG